MALEMQNVLYMKIAIGAFLSLILVTGLPATAEESACVKSFRKANAEFFKTHAQIERRQWEAQLGTGVGIVSGLGCMFLRRSVMGVVGCGSFGALIGGGSYAYSVVQEDKLSRMYDAHRLYQAYYAVISDEIQDSKDAQALASDLGIDKQKEKAALKELATLIEWGSLCEGEQTRSYKEALELMKGRLHAIQ
jgi:hypothetical protein